MKKNFLIIISVLLASCAQNPDINEKMLSQEEHIHEISSNWQTGHELVRKGNKSVRSGESLVRKGKQMIERGNHKISKGKKMVKDGEKMMKRSQKTFEKEFPSQADEE